MHSCWFVVVFVLLGIVQSRQYRSQDFNEVARFLGAYRRYMKNHLNTRYKEDQYFDRQVVEDTHVQLDYHYTNTTINPDFFSKLITEGAQGYAYSHMALGAAPGGSGIVQDNAMIKVGNSNSTYMYDFRFGPKNSEELLVQVNTEGVQGYRLLRRQFYRNGEVWVYSKNTGKSNAQYSYRHLPSVNSLEEMLNQINQQGADGYQYKGPFNYEPYSNLYIKDESLASQYVCLPAPFVNTSTEYSDQVNQLGSQGYRWVGTKWTPVLDTSGAITRLLYQLLCKDLTKPSATFTYELRPQPITLADHLADLKAQANRGFIFEEYQTFPGNMKFIVYANMDNCQCNDIEERCSL